jgi:CRP-like cAMP-binding protein
MSHNFLLDSLTGKGYAEILPHLESNTLAQGDVLTYSHQRINHVYFPSSAIVALLVQMEDGEAVEIGLVGKEGMVNLPVFWGEERVHYTAIVLHAGNALRMHADLFRRFVKGTDEFHKSLMSYTGLFFSCAAQHAACYCLHSIKQRIASWLLSSRDFLERDRFYVTHDVIAGELGVRRASVTVALNEFNRNGVLRQQRGRISIIKPQGLERCACECYRIIKTALEVFRDARE